jgi:hypothetical protein
MLGFDYGFNGSRDHSLLSQLVWLRKDNIDAYQGRKPAVTEGTPVKKKNRMC